MRLRQRVVAAASGIIAVGAVGLTAVATVSHGGAMPSAYLSAASASICGDVRVGPAQEVVSTATRNRLGLDVWPDTAMGVLRDGTGRYQFYATGTPGSRPPQKVVVSTGTLANPVSGGAGSNLSVTNVPSEYDYAGGGPVYRDAASGLVLETLHLEHAYANDPMKFYTELDLGVVDQRGHRVVRLGPIVAPHATFAQAAKTQATIDLGVSSLTVTKVGSVPYLYVYFPDASADQAGHISFTGLSVARAPLRDVLAAAKKGKVTPWRKYDGGRWSRPALGGASSDLNPGQGLAWHPDVVRTTSGSLMVTGVSPHEMTLATSADGVTKWSARQPLFRDPDVFDAYPTVVGAGSNRAVPGKQFFVYYTQWQSPAPDWSKARLMRRTVTCTQGLRGTEVPLVRYSNGSRHQVTTGPVAGAGFHQEGRWYLRSGATVGTVPLYGCLNGAVDQFLDKDANCGGSQYAILQTEGWIYVHRPAAPAAALYRCHIGGIGDHFVSTRSDCEAPGNPNVVLEGLLGYALTS